MFRALRRTGAGVVAGGSLLAVLALTGCGGGGPAAGPTTGVGAPADPVQSSAPAAAPSKPATPHNEADIAFARAMIPHNVQVLASTQIAGSRAVKPKVKAIATTLGDSQVGQIEEMSSWLANWGEPVPAGAAASPGGTGITQSDLVKLSETAPTGFDKLWLTTMIKHQQSAVSLARTELKSGTSTEAKALAQKIIEEQKTQITTMQTLLKAA